MTVWEVTIVCDNHEKGRETVVAVFTRRGAGSGDSRWQPVAPPPPSKRTKRNQEARAAARKAEASKAATPWEFFTAIAVPQEIRCSLCGATPRYGRPNVIVLEMVANSGKSRISLAELEAVERSRHVNPPG